MDVDPSSFAESIQQVLAVGLDVAHHQTVQPAGGSESILRARHRDRSTNEPIRVVERKPMNGVTLRHASASSLSLRGGDRSGALVFCELPESAPMALVAGKRGREKGRHNRHGVSFTVHPCTDRHYIGVVVVAGQLGDVDAPAQRSPYAIDFVRCDLLSVSRTAQYDPKAAGVSNHASSGRQAEWWIVVERVKDLGAMIDNLIAGGLQGFDKNFLQRKTRMI